VQVLLSLVCVEAQAGTVAGGVAAGATLGSAGGRHARLTDVFRGDPGTTGILPTGLVLLDGEEPSVRDVHACSVGPRPQMTVTKFEKWGQFQHSNRSGAGTHRTFSRRGGPPVYIRNVPDSNETFWPFKETVWPFQYPR
jgi:hypothetical protein